MTKGAHARVTRLGGTQRRKASDIYKKQNTLFHRAFAAEGLPYEANKDTWLSLATSVIGRTVAGLSEMTLAERHMLIVDLRKKGRRLFAPAVPPAVRDWKKGDPDVEYGFRESDDSQLRMVYAMWAEMGYAEKTLRGLCWKRFQVDDPRWLDDEQLSRLVNTVKARAEQKGLGHYYRR
jgi:Bacteriophage Mu, GemA protein